jgi:anti-anti-sigma regulatory factor
MTVKITQIDAAKDLTVLKIEGKLAATDAVLLTEIVERLAAGELFSIDMSGVTYIDRKGAAIIRRLEEFGAELIGVDFFVQSVIDTYSDSKK